MTNEEVERIAEDARILKTLEEIFNLSDREKNFIRHNILHSMMHPERLDILYRYIETWAGQKYIDLTEKNR